MKYPIAIEMGGPKKTWGVVVPDLPGCFSAADSGIDEAIENAKEAIELDTDRESTFGRKGQHDNPRAYPGDESPFDYRRV